jgi:hypothetical protein
MNILFLAPDRTVSGQVLMCGALYGGRWCAKNWLSPCLFGQDICPSNVDPGNYHNVTAGDRIGYIPSLLDSP